MARPLNGKAIQWPRMATDAHCLVEGSVGPTSAHPTVTNAGVVGDHGGGGMVCGQRAAGEGLERALVLNTQNLIICICIGGH